MDCCLKDGKRKIIKNEIIDIEKVINNSLYKAVVSFVYRAEVYGILYEPTNFFMITKHATASYLEKDGENIHIDGSKEQTQILSELILEAEKKLTKQ